MVTLEEIDAAIAQALQGKNIQLGDRSYTSQDLQTLLAMRTTISAVVVTTAGGSRSRLAAFSKGV